MNEVVCSVSGIDYIYLLIFFHLQVVNLCLYTAEKRF